MKYLRFKCKRKQKNTPLECRGMLGGISIETILSHNYKDSPFKDIRYCQECRRMIEITITDLDSIPVMVALPKDEKVDFVDPEDVFRLIEVHR